MVRIGLSTVTKMMIMITGFMICFVYSWFAVHCTSMNNTNGLISSDNKGYASQLFERNMTAQGNLAITVSCNFQVDFRRPSYIGCLKLYYFFLIILKTFIYVI